MQIAGATALVTGANRGIGARFVAELLDRGAARIYAAARQPDTLERTVASADGRVEAVQLDINDPSSAEAAAAMCPGVDLLINNAGLLNFGGPLDAPIYSLRQEMETNYFGLINTTRAFVPVLEAAGGGAILNVLTIIALAPMRGMGGYCASKAAARSITQSLRADLASRSIDVHGSFPGGVDTDMLASVDGPKANPLHVAAASLDGVEQGIRDITPDEFSTDSYRAWLDQPDALEDRFVGN